MAGPGTDELLACAEPATGRLWRAVESQHYAATRRLVSNHADQQRLETLLEGSKPTYRPGTEHLDYLLKTPFRYQPPKRGGSRFRRPYAPFGAFYAAEERQTALAEFVYHRYRFFEASEAQTLPGNEQTLTVVAAGYDTQRRLDLTAAPLDRHRDAWTDPTDYSATQRLGERAAHGGIGVIHYESVRDRRLDADGIGVGRNGAVINPLAFDPPYHQYPQTWYVYVGEAEANVRRAHAGPAETIDFPRSLFRMPGPE